MNKQEFIENLSKKTGRTQSELDKLLEGLKNIIGEKLYNGGAVKLPGIGTFSSIFEDEAIVYDTKSDKTIIYPPIVTIEFNTASTLLLKLREKTKI